MRALVKEKKGHGNIEVKDCDIPDLKEDEVLIEVYYGGICGTDIHIWKDEFPYNPPVILGHEFSGVIVKKGSGVTNWEKGDRVVAEPHTRSCKNCEFCRTGNPQACSDKKAPGWGIDGGFAEYIKLPSRLLHGVPDGISLQEAAIVEPAAISAHSLYQRADMKVGDFVVVLGPGPIGLILVQLAQIKGASRTMITGIEQDSENRLPLAEELGVDYAVNIDKIDPVKKVKSISDKGADLVIEAAGVESTVNQAFEMVKWSGSIGVVGLPGPEKLNVKWAEGAFKSVDLNFSFSSNYTDWEQILKLLGEDKLDLYSLITGVYSLEEWEEAFNRVKKGKEVKALFEIKQE